MKPNFSEETKETLKIIPASKTDFLIDHAIEKNVSRLTFNLKFFLHVRGISSLGNVASTRRSNPCTGGITIQNFCQNPDRDKGSLVIVGAN